MLRILRALLLLLPLTSYAAPPTTVAEATDQLVGLLLDGAAAEYRAARRIHTPDPASGVAYVFFALEGFGGGNNYAAYLALFTPEPLREKGATATVRYRLLGYAWVGGKLWRDVDFDRLTVDGQRITLQTKEYASDDGSCCPSIAATATYVLDTQLHEVTDAQAEAKPPAIASPPTHSPADHQ